MTTVLDPHRLASQPDTQPVPSLADVRRRHTRIRDVNAEHSRARSRLDRVSSRITDRVGSLGFVLIVVGWAGVGLGWVIFSAAQSRLDATTPFGVWLFASALIQTALLPLILFGQQAQGRHFALRAKADFEAAKRAEAEIDTVVEHLVNQNGTILDILHRVEGIERSIHSDGPALTGSR